MTSTTAVSAREWIGNAELAMLPKEGRSTVTVKIAAGGIAIVELTARK
jgi:hypothetical protein